MKFRALCTLLACGVGSLVAAEAPAEKADPVAKKGFGLPERKGMDAHHLELLKVGWYYNWGESTKLTTHAQFVPMVYSGRRDAPKSKEKFLLDLITNFIAAQVKPFASLPVPPCLLELMR